MPTWRRLHQPQPVSLSTASANGVSRSKHQGTSRRRVQAQARPPMVKWSAASSRENGARVDANDRIVQAAGGVLNSGKPREASVTIDWYDEAPSRSKVGRFSPYRRFLLLYGLARLKPSPTENCITAARLEMGGTFQEKVFPMAATSYRTLTVAAPLVVAFTTSAPISSATKAAGIIFPKRGFS